MAARRSGESPEWPVYYFGSDTTGEKAYEEFFTADEQVDLTSHHALGVILNASRRSISEIDAMLSALAARFDAADTTKADIVETMKSFLGNFNHEEKGRNLDSRM